MLRKAFFTLLLTIDLCFFYNKYIPITSILVFHKEVMTRDYQNNELLEHSLQGSENLLKHVCVRETEKAIDGKIFSSGQDNS